MKHKSRATRFSAAINAISLLREEFESMKSALDTLASATEAADEANKSGTVGEKIDTQDTLQKAKESAEIELGEHSEAFDNADVCAFEELRDELQNWLDNLPENLQNGSKADTLSDSISSLEEVISYVEDINSAGNDFSAADGFSLSDIEERVGALETAIENCENAEGTDVEFPGMFG